MSSSTSRQQLISEGYLGGNSWQEPRTETMQEVAYWLHLSGWLQSTLT